ncbi:DUF4040 domain-containing protein [Motiliproteus sp. SC1-56]|uniref:DUF4040 domain-containing protein n=1 Tax=Motiliproteus sp. SC1-56 TaxID=2799565 RepID=UPI001F5C741E|nr:DUF4040 domain-containing protein [Motiliproteus sp. SC1-56]
MTAIAAIRQRDLFAVVMLFGIYSLLTAGLFMNLDAVDVAFTEAAVGAGTTTVLMLSTLRLTGRYQRRSSHSPLLPLLVVTVTGAALVYGTLDAPLLGDPGAPAHQHVAPRYIESGLKEVGTPNLVTAVLASYRGYDTLGETLVIFTAGLAVLLLLGVTPCVSQRPQAEPLDDQAVLKLVVKVLIPLVLLYGLYVQFHGDYGAGGGFQAGVIFATGFVLYGLVFGDGNVQRVLPPHGLRRLAACGVLLYGGVGLVSLFRGGAFLDYDQLATDPIAGQHLGIFLVELGVGLNVFAVVMLIFFAFSSRRGEP